MVQLQMKQYKLDYCDVEPTSDCLGFHAELLMLGRSEQYMLVFKNKSGEVGNIYVKANAMDEFFESKGNHKIVIQSVEHGWQGEVIVDLKTGELYNARLNETKRMI